MDQAACGSGLLKYGYAVMNFFSASPETALQYSQTPVSALLLAERGAAVLAVASAWVAGPLKEEHWLTLLRARAIENTCYVVAADQPGRKGIGRSAAFDPAGLALLDLGAVDDALGVVDASLDRLAEVEPLRPLGPEVAHRRQLLGRLDAGGHERQACVLDRVGELFQIGPGPTELRRVQLDDVDRGGRRVEDPVAEAYADAAARVATGREHSVGEGLDPERVVGRQVQPRRHGDRLSVHQRPVIGHHWPMEERWRTTSG